ncbi:MAG: DUF3108 domain-containing protein [Alphaproteobacteria bacterium]|nr:DUF3108 domain-containing protein [Alphaproteobacteria bacterium]
MIRHSASRSKFITVIGLAGLIPALLVAGSSSLAHANQAGSDRATSVVSRSPISEGSQPVRASYDVYFGGFHVLSSTAMYERGETDYAVSATGRTQGILEFFFEWAGETRTTGRFNGPRVFPILHESRGQGSSEERRMSIRYDESGEVADLVVEPTPDPEEVTPLPENADDGTIDPLTVFADLGRSVSEGRGCTGTYAVFDGKRRYDLTVSDRGEEVLQPTSYSVFSGPALACHVEWDMKGGARREKNKYSRTARDRTVYVAAPFEGAEPIPVAMSIETDYGTLMAHLTSVEAGGRRLAVPTD